MIFRDRDADTDWWDDPADDTREERVYYCQNWRADVSTLLTDDGSLIQWTKYSAYGVPFGLPGLDTDSDGDFDSTDAGNIGGTYDVREDFNLDGVADISDLLDALDKLGGFQALGWGAMSSSLTANRRGYAGYEYDPVLETAGRHLYHIRRRAYDAGAGRWMRRDPMGYIDGLGLYRYCKNRPHRLNDPSGTSCMPVLLSGTSPTPRTPPLKSPHKPKFPNYYHESQGVYYSLTFDCGDGPQTVHGNMRMDEVYNLLKRIHNISDPPCCISDLRISAHYNGTSAYSCENGEDAVSGSALAGVIRLCRQATVDLNMCYSCGLAQTIADNNPQAFDSMIECTTNENRHYPPLDCEAWPNWFDDQIIYVPNPFMQNAINVRSSDSPEGWIPGTCIR